MVPAMSGAMLLSAGVSVALGWITLSDKLGAGGIGTVMAEYFWMAARDVFWLKFSSESRPRRYPMVQKNTLQECCIPPMTSRDP